MTRHTNHNGFTLIELIIVIVILGILAGVSIPKYQDITSSAKRESTNGALGGLRTAISVWRSGNIVRMGSSVWPPLDSMNTIGSVVLQAIPQNPYQHSTNAPDSIVLGVTKGVIVGTRGGWAYKPSTGEIWANTSTTISGTGCAGPTVIDENLW